MISDTRTDLANPLFVPDSLPPLPTTRYLPSTIKGSSLRYIFWCCESLDLLKAGVVIGFVKAEAPDLVVLTNVLLEHRLIGKKIVLLTDRLGKETGQPWFGLSSPNAHACLGGTILLYTERISSLHVDHLLPFGSLMAISGTWDASDFTILSIQWNLNDDEPRGGGN